MSQKPLISTGHGFSCSHPKRSEAQSRDLSVPEDPSPRGDGKSRRAGELTFQEANGRDEA